jgi:hypothetical protein
MNAAVTDVRDLVAAIKKDPKSLPSCESEHL